MERERERERERGERGERVYIHILLACGRCMLNCGWFVFHINFHALMNNEFLNFRVRLTSYIRINKIHQPYKTIRQINKHLNKENE